MKGQQNGAFEKTSRIFGGHVEANDFTSCLEFDAGSGTEIDVMPKADNYTDGFDLPGSA